MYTLEESQYDPPISVEDKEFRLLQMENQAFDEKRRVAITQKILDIRWMRENASAQRMHESEKLQRNYVPEEGY